MPSIADAFREQTFQRFSSRGNPVDGLIDSILGVHVRSY